jgi:hypothetical protein
MGRAMIRAACLIRLPRLAPKLNRRRSWVAPAIAVLAALGACAAVTAPRAHAQEEKETLFLLDDEQISAVVARIDSDGVITGSGVPEGLTLDWLRRIERPVEVVERPDRAVVTIHLAGGGRISAQWFSLAKERCLVEWRFGKDLDLPIDAIRSVVLEAGEVPQNVRDAIDAPSAEFDRIFIKTDEGLQGVPGLLVEVGKESFVFEWNDDRRTLPRDRLYAVVLAKLQSDSGSPCRVRLRDGSTLPGAIEQLADGVLTMRLGPASKVDFSWSAVHAVDVRSSRMTYLSDLDPTDVEEQPVVTFGWNWQRDASVQGRPLTLGERQFAKGIGVHANSQLTFDADEEYHELLAVVGIDSETEGRGDCVFEVLGDGRSMWTQRVKGNDPPRPLRVDISGVRRVTLAVHAGADLDLADHADWCDVRFIKKP